MVSKKALVRDGIYPDSRKGSQPSKAKEIQPSDTTAKPSRTRTSRSKRVDLKAVKPTKKVMSAEIIK
jgi:hypothetical protein